ncbi:hypothetical protein BY458DRAFT_471506 [Sporodiniella umbellata]|nr:hypothetical protein BY458DRAFT_471506 [Sporodiniella umbellata]
MHGVYDKKDTEDTSLLSPPLTPIEFTSTDSLYHYPKNRKSFIESYSRMVPYLQPKNHTSNGRVFTLNVYRDLLPLNRVSKISSKRCTMLNKTVSVSPKKRKCIQAITKDKQPSQKKKRVSSVLPSGKDAALAFDSVDIQSIDSEFYPSGWIPSLDALDSIPVKVTWKGAALSIDRQPLYNKLHRVEAAMSSTLRLSPTQYLRCKRTLIMAARTLKQQEISFTKSVAQKLCRVDVNKTSALWTAFGQLGWLDESN